MDIFRHPFVATCSESYRQLSGRADQDLRPITRSRIDRHLARCPACRQMFERVTRTMEALRGMSATEHPSIANTVADRIRHDHPSYGDAP